jgi:hypothetical protein
MTEEINTHNLTVNFGRHKGKRYTRIPVNYLLWMVNSRHSKAEIARAELKRRGTVLPMMDISGHAIDRASQYGLEIWKSTAQKNEGLHAWLHRMALEAMKRNPEPKDGKYPYKGMVFIIQADGVWPVLKTVRKND